MKMTAKLKIIKSWRFKFYNAWTLRKAHASHIVDKYTWFGRHNYSINGIRNTRTPRARGYLI